MQALLVLLLFAVVSAEAVNNRPIIGILAQETPDSWSEYFPQYKSYIAASYVKWVESSGARAVPIWINQERSYYEGLARKLNGILYPGGAASLTDSGYLTAGKALYEEAIKVNQDGVHLPIWASCLGFELLVELVAEDRVRIRCDSYDVALPLDFTKDAKKSHLFGDLPKDVLGFIRNKNVTANYHHYCFTPEQFEEIGNLKKNLKVLSTNIDTEGLEFVSSIEHKKLPFYATQWHPEKNSFEWKSEKTGIPHTYEAIRTAQYFGEFFINEARKNDNRFENETEEEKYLIYQQQPIYSELQTAYTQIYFFE